MAYERFLADRGRKVREAGEADAEAYVMALTSAGRRPSSVTRALVALRALHRWCGSDTAAFIGSPQPSSAEPSVLSEAEVAALLEVARGASATSRRDRALLEVLYATGARISEVVGLSFDDVENGLARFAGRWPRVVPYGEPAAEALAAWRSSGGRETMAVTTGAAGGGTAAVFLNHRGGRLSRQWGWEVVRSHGDRVGLRERLGPHVLRHSFAAHLAGRGAPPTAVRQMLVGRPRVLDDEGLRGAYRQWHPRP